MTRLILANSGISSTSSLGGDLESGFLMAVRFCGHPEGGKRPARHSVSKTEQQEVSFFLFRDITRGLLKEDRELFYRDEREF